MPKRGLAALAITTVALILLISFKVPDEPVLDRTSGNVAIVEPSRTATAPRSTSAPAAATAPPRATSAPTAAGASATVDGPLVDTRFGPVQVEVVIVGGKVSDVVALQLPSGRRSGRISDYSEPILREEALQA